MAANQQSLAAPAIAAKQYGGGAAAGARLGRARNRYARQAAKRRIRRATGNKPHGIRTVMQRRKCGGSNGDGIPGNAIARSGQAMRGRAGRLARAPERRRSQPGGKCDEQIPVAAAMRNGLAINNAAYVIMRRRGKYNPDGKCARSGGGDGGRNAGLPARRPARGAGVPARPGARCPATGAPGGGSR